MDKTKTEYRVFFSWQSDLPIDLTTGAIREALSQAINDIEGRYPGIKVFSEEATSNTAGSPDIPSTIFGKISLADIFISDITTINGYAEADKRKVANPNVLIELGFALSELGPERLIMLFNQVLGQFPQDLPFDIDNRRIGKFSVKDKKDTNGKNYLRRLLTDAIEIIITQNPLKPSQKRQQKPEEIKRALDIINLKRALSTIYIPMLDNHIVIAPKQVNTKILHYYESFRGVLLSSTFSLYDKRAFELLNNLYKHWADSLAGDYYYETKNENIKAFGNEPGKPLTPTEKEKFEMMTKSIGELHKSLKELLNYIRENYLEIAIDEMSNAAFEEYQAFHKEQ